MSSRRMAVQEALLALSVLLLAQTGFAGGAATSAEQSGIVMVTNWGEDTVGLVNVDSGQVLSTIQVGHKPYDIKVGPDGRFAYVTNSGGSEVSVIDIQANLESHRIRVGTSPRDISLSADGTRAVVANSGDDTISLVDLVNRRELYTVPVGGIPYGVAHLADGVTVLITNWGENSLSVVRLGEAGGEVIRTVSVPALPYTVVVPAIGDWAYMTNFGAGVVTPVHLVTFDLGAPIPVGKSPWGIGTSIEGDIAAIANFFENKVSILNTQSRSVVQNVTLGSRPPAGPEGTVTMRRAKNTAVSARLIVASDLAANEIIVIDRATHEILRTIPVGKAPYGLAFVARTTGLASRGSARTAPAKSSR